MKVSAGILVYRHAKGGVEVLLAHNGGPFFKNKDNGYWTIPKGLIEDGEDELSAAKREFQEETSLRAPEGEYLELGTVKQKNNKIVHAWAVEADLDESIMKSNKVPTEWPPQSGQTIMVPEIDQYGWFLPDKAKIKANQAQSEFIDRLLEELDLPFLDVHKQTDLL